MKQFFLNSCYALNIFLSVYRRTPIRDHALTGTSLIATRGKSVINKSCSTDLLGLVEVVQKKGIDAAKSLLLLLLHMRQYNLNEMREQPAVQYERLLTPQRFIR